MKRPFYLLIALASVFYSTPAFACDICAVHNLLSVDEGDKNSWSLGLSEQLSSYGKIQQNDDTISNPSEQYLRSSVTQLSLGYKPLERLGFQLTAPFIYRRYRQVESSEKNNGTVNGIGDVSLLARYQAYNREGNNSTVMVTLLGGVKLPTGDASDLRPHEHESASMEEMGHDDALEEGHDDESHPDSMEGESDMEDMADDHHHDDDSHAVMHEGHDHDAVEASAVHGHDIALGTGSVDIVSGGFAMARYGRGFVSGQVLFTYRNEGSHDYRFGNDLQWNFGPGVYLQLEDEQLTMLRAAFSGEAKGRDTQNGDKENDTGIISYFAGPELSIVRGGNLRLDLGVDLPIEIKNTGTQAVADYRIRGAVSYRF